MCAKTPVASMQYMSQKRIKNFYRENWPEETTFKKL